MWSQPAMNLFQLLFLQKNAGTKYDYKGETSSWQEPYWCLWTHQLWPNLDESHCW